jgi:hypothetical protein
MSKNEFVEKVMGHLRQEIKDVEYNNLVDMVEYDAYGAPRQEMAEELIDILESNDFETTDRKTIVDFVKSYYMAKEQEAEILLRDELPEPKYEYTLGQFDYSQKFLRFFEEYVSE